MDLKELGTTSSVSTNDSNGSTKFALSSPTVPSSRSKSYDVGSNSLGKVATTAARPCAIIGPDRVLPSNPDDTMYLKKVPGEVWPPPENIYRRPPDYPSKVSNYQPTRNISPRQTFQENMQRIMVPPTFSSMKSSDESSVKNTKLNTPQEVKYCDVPYNLNSVNSEHKSATNLDIPMSNVNPSYARNMPPPYGWPGGVNVQPLRPYGAPEFYQYQEFPSCAGPRPMTMIRPHRPLHEESAQVYSDRLYQDGNIRFKPYPTGKEKQQQPRYDYISNYPSTFHPPASLPPNKYDMQKTINGHPYPVYPSVPFKYLDRRIHEPFVDGYHRTHHQQSNFNAFHNQVVPPPYGPLPGNCMQNKTYSDASSKSMNVNKMQFENNNKVYLNLESRNKNYPVPENLYYTEMNHSQAMRGEILLPTHSAVNMHPVPQHSIYRKDNTPLKPYDYNPNYRMFDRVHQSLQRLPSHFSPNTISPTDSNTSNDTIHTIGTSQEDCGYVSQSSTASIRSLDSSNMPMSHHDPYRRHSYNNYDMFRNTFHSNGPIQNTKNKISSSNKKNLDVRQFLQMWNEGDEEFSEGNKEAAAQNHAKKLSQNEIINNQEQLYVLGLVNVPSEELGKYEHIQKISKLPENIKGYNSLEILNQYEELLETPRNVNNFSKSREYNAFSKSLMDKGITSKMPRSISPLDVEAKISQSVIHKEVGCNFEIKPCSPEMLNVELAAPVQNILGERIIEKVVNPIMSKSPNLTRSGNNKLQNTVNDEVKVASCKMMSDQYLSNGSSNRIKMSNYSMQDLENNAGLCLASLPQLDNDIELNFPEINQQFMKANHIESNITPGIQNVSHKELEQTHHCLPHEIKSDLQQHILSPQLASVGDKEFSKLSKYRKGRKSELTSSHNIKQDSIKSSDSIAASQRIDSVIIKNPESQYNDSVKISSDSNQDIKYQEEPKQSYSSLKYERYDHKCDLSSETAIDFSLSRSEDETAVRYLNAIDSNQNLPQLEGFDEAGLNEDDNISDSKLQNAPAHDSSMSSTEVVDEPESERLEFKLCEEYENGIQNISQEMIERNDGLIKVLVKSPKVEENEELVMRKLGTDEPEIPENVTSSENTKNTDSLVLNITNTNSLCQESNEENLFTKPRDTVHSKYIDIAKDKNESSYESKNCDMYSTVNSGLDCEHNRDKFPKSKKNEIVSNMLSEMSIDTKSCNACFENNNNLDVTQKQTIQDVLDDLSNQDNNILNNKSDMSSYHMVKSDITENFTASLYCHRKNEDIAEDESNRLLVSDTNKENHMVKSDITENFTASLYSHRKNEEIAEDESNRLLVSDTNKENHMVKSDITENFTASLYSHRNNEEIAEDESNRLLVSDTNKETIGVVLEKTDLTDTNQSVTSIFSERDIKFDVYKEELSAVVSQHDSETIVINTSDIMSSTSEEIDNAKTETNLTKIAECNSETTLRSTEVIPQQDSKIEMDVSEFEYLSENNVINNCNEIDLSTSTVTCLVTQKSNHKLAQNDCVSNLDSSTFELKNETCFLRDNTESTTPSTEELVGPKQEIKTILPATVLEGNNETDMDIGESECLSNKTEMTANMVEVPCLSFNKTTLENPDVIIPKCRNKTEMNRYPKTNYDTNIVPVEPGGLSGKFCIEANTVEKSCLFKENINNLENPSVKNAELGFEIDIDIAESKCLSTKPIINFTNSLKESYLTSNNQIIGEKSTVKIMDYRQEKEINDSIQEDYKTNVDITESNCIPDPINNLEESFFTIGNETIPEDTIVQTTGFSQIIEKHENDLIKVVTLDINNSDIGTDPANGLNTTVELAHKDNTSEFNDETNIENKSLQSWKCQTYLKVYETRQYQDLKKERMNCRKELFSPWFQKLLIFTEGVCKSILNKNLTQVDNCSQVNNDSLVKQNDEVVSSKKYNMEAFKSRNNEVNYELRDVDKEAILLNNHARHDINEVSPNECHENQVVKADNVKLNDRYKHIQLIDYKIPPSVVNDDSVIIKPQKISKRSLSDSALEAFKDNDDINMVPCKRKKADRMIGNPRILDSRMISEDICNIIQTNRRNSISTFYNEDNVYIVIDNNLILAEENDDSEKICYTESTEEFLTSIDAINCEINLDLETSFTNEPKQICEYSDSLQHIEENSIEDSWVEDVACIETVFSEDVAENIIIDVQASPKKANCLDFDNVEESTVFYDSDHIDKIKSIYGHNMCNDNSELIETLYRTPQMNVNKTLYHIESQDPKECINAIMESCFETNEHIDCTGIAKTRISSHEVVGNKENMSENVPLNSNQSNKNIYPNINHNNNCKIKEFSTDEQKDKLTIYSCESSNNHLTLNVQKENSAYSCSSSPEVSSTTSEEKNSNFLLKITNCNGSRISQINEVSTESQNKLSYKLTEKGEYQSYSSSRTLITKAAQKYIPPLKDTIYDLKVKLPLPQHRLHTLKQLKIAKVEPKVATANISSVKKLNHDNNKKPKPKFEDVLKSIDEINFKRHKDNIKKGKISIPKVIIKKNKNGAHYASSKTTNSKEAYNPDLTGRKWQPWVFLEKNNFVDRMALQNKAKAVYCHRKHNYVLSEKFRKYKSVYNANFVISQPKSDTKGNLKYTIRLKHIN